MNFEYDLQKITSLDRVQTTFSPTQMVWIDQQGNVIRHSIISEQNALFPTFTPEHPFIDTLSAFFQQPTLIINLENALVTDQPHYEETLITDEKQHYFLQFAKISATTTLSYLLTLQNRTHIQEMVDQLWLRDQAISAIAEGITISDPALADNPIIYANPGFEKMTGYLISQILGKNCRFLQGKKTSPQSIQEIRNALKEKRSCVVELINYHADGTQLWNRLSINPIFDEQGQLIHYVGVQLDITQRKKLEQDLRERAKELEQLNARIRESEQKLAVLNENKNKLFSLISHDLKSPFHSLMGFAEILAGDLTPYRPEEIREFGEHIHSMTHKLFHLITHLLQWSQFETGNMQFDRQVIDASTIVNNAIAILEGNAHRKAILLQNKVNPQLKVYADAVMLQMILQNLISNSIKFTPQGGKVSILTKEITADRVEISVQDTGIGIRPEIQKQLFTKPFFTLESDTQTGTGLGLLLCKELVEKNLGEIGVESTVGEGSRFWFTLHQFSGGE